MFETCCSLLRGRFTRSQSAGRKPQWWEKNNQESGDKVGKKNVKWWAQGKIDYGEDAEFKESCRKTKEEAIQRRSRKSERDGSVEIPIRREAFAETMVTVRPQVCWQERAVHCDQTYVVDVIEDVVDVYAVEDREAFAEAMVTVPRNAVTKHLNLMLLFMLLIALLMLMQYCHYRCSCLCCWPGVPAGVRRPLRPVAEEEQD